MKHLQGQVNQSDETKHLEHSASDQEYGKRSHSIATKHSANKLNDKINWEIITGKSEAGDQLAIQIVKPLNRDTNTTWQASKPITLVLSHSNKLQ